MGTFHTVGRVGELAEGEAAPVTLAGRTIAVFHSDGGYFALDDFCPHMGAPLSGGLVEDGCVTCPWHAWRFRLADGAWADNPKLKTGSYAVRVVDGEIQVELPEEAT